MNALLATGVGSQAWIILGLCVIAAEAGLRFRQKSLHRSELRRRALTREIGTVIAACEDVARRHHLEGVGISVQFETTDTIWHGHLDWRMPTAWTVTPAKVATLEDLARDECTVPFAGHFNVDAISKTLVASPAVTRLAIAAGTNVAVMTFDTDRLHVPHDGSRPAPHEMTSG